MKNYLILLMLGVAAPAFAQTALPSDAPTPTASPRHDVIATTAAPTIATTSSVAGDVSVATASDRQTTSAAAVTATDAAVSPVAAAPTTVTIGATTVTIAPAAGVGASAEPARPYAGAPGQEVGQTDSAK